METTSKTLNELKEIIDETTDSDILDAAEQVVGAMHEIHKMKQQIEKMEESMCEGSQAMFYFFASSLIDEDLSWALQHVKGRKRFLKEKHERESPETANGDESIEK